MSSSSAAEAQTQNPQDPPTQNQDELDKQKKLAVEMAKVIEDSLARVKPMLKMMTDEVNKANKTPKEDLDEQALVDKLRPLIELCAEILHETQGKIKGMDPDCKLANQAQRNYADHNATAEEQRLAKSLAELTGDVTKTIENAKEKIKDMPKAGPQLDAMFGLLTDPLFQILSAVGLLLNGVLTLVGNLLDGLGLGGIVRGLLTGLGLDKILKSLGLGKMFEKKKNDK